MTVLYKFLRKILIAVFALCIITPCFALDLSPDISPEGSWATEHNRELVTSRITEELNKFGPTATTVSNSYVPIEAKLGLAFMGGLSRVGTALERPLVNFLTLFILIAYAFWVAFEAYNLIIAKTETNKVVKDIVIKGIFVAAWLLVMNHGLAKSFADIIMPLVSIGTFLSNTIWESIVNSAGFTLTDTCEAIKNYANTPTNLPADLQISSDAAAELLCIPTQMTTFFTSIIGIGWKWVVMGVGMSLFGVLTGLYVTYLALKNIWKYLFMALSVIADLFISLLLLPFTAVAETTAKTNYKGVAGDIFNSFLGIFKAENLETQITRIIKASLYFVCLALATGIALSLLTFVINPQTGELLHIATFDGFNGGIILILTLLLVSYLADKAQELSDKWGAKIDDSLGQQTKKDAEKLWKITKDNWKKLRNLRKK